MQQQEVQQPLSPTSKHLNETGALVEEESTDGRKLAAELLSFEGLPRLSKTGDPLLWWRVHETSLPMLASIVKDIFAIPAFSSKSERVFSIGSKVINRSGVAKALFPSINLFCYVLALNFLKRKHV